MSQRAYRILPTDSTTFYPRLIGTRGAVAANSYLSVDAGVDILKAGGNAFDAAVAATLVEGLVNPQMHTIGGECPILIHLAGEARVLSINGNMAAPMAATPEAFLSRGLKDVPEEGILAAGVPAAFSAPMTVLKRWGRPRRTHRPEAARQCGKAPPATPVPGEDRAQQPRDDEHVLAVRHGLEDVLLDPFAIEQHALLVAARAEVACLARVSE